MLIKIIGIGFVCTILALFLKQYKPEYSMLISVVGAFLIFVIVLSSLSELIDEIFAVGNLTGIDGELFMPILKIIGVGYITEFISDTADDCGNKLLANKIIMGGKVAILVIALPIIKNLIETILSVIL